MIDATGFAEALLGLDGFRVLDVFEDPLELVITIESTLDLVGCAGCGVRAQSQDRVKVDVRNLPCFSATGATGVGQAAVALPGRVVRCQDMDRTQ